MENKKPGSINEEQRQNERSRSSALLKEMKRLEKDFMKNKVWKKENHYTWRPEEKQKYDN